MSKDIEEYIRNVTDNLVKNGYSELQIEQICNNIRDIQKYKDSKNNSFELTNWKNIIRTNKEMFKDVKSNDIKYFIIHGNITAVVIRLNSELYSVAFSFIHHDDLCYMTDKITPLTKKHTLWNYVNYKYRYDNIKATSSINALTLAFNKNIKDFPRNCYLSKITPYLKLMYFDTDPYYSTDNNYCVSPEYKPYLNLHKDYKNFKNKLFDKVHNFANVRFYLEFSTFNVMVVKNEDNTHTVTFSFIHSNDKCISRMESNSNIIKMCKMYTIQNYLNDKYSYKITDAKNSISAVVRAYNLYKHKFPSKNYKNSKMTIDICDKRIDFQEYIAYLKCK
jgi:hypothetical protein